MGRARLALGQRARQLHKRALRDRCPAGRGDSGQPQGPRCLRRAADATGLDAPLHRLTPMGPGTVYANGVDLCVETFGDATDPAILLVMGAGASMDWWQDDLRARLAAGPRYVIRYDHRDTGQSASYPPGEPGIQATI